MAMGFSSKLKRGRQPNQQQQASQVVPEIYLRLYPQLSYLDIAHQKLGLEWQLPRLKNCY